MTNMQGPSQYPSQWRPAGAPPFDEPPNVEAVVLAIDQYLVALSDEQFAALVARVRNGQQQQPQRGQQPQYGQSQASQY